MNWKAINLHIEILVPGIILCSEFFLLFKDKLLLEIPRIPDSFAIAIFIAASYGLGIISSLFSRALIDYLSELGIRSIVFTMLAHRDSNKLHITLKSNDDYYNDDYLREKERFLRTKIEKIARWNAIYRGVLRSVMKSNNDKAKDEIYRRREIARLIRNLIIPFTLAFYIFFIPFWIVIFFVFVLCLFLYAYSELSIFAEAIDICDPFIKKENLNEH